MFFFPFVSADSDNDTYLLWAMSLDLYAQYLVGRHHYSEALKQFESAYQTNCTVQGENHPQSIVLLNSMGKMREREREKNIQTSFERTRT